MDTNISINYFKLGESIKSKRKSMGLTQEQLAEKIDLSPTHISNIETGKAKLSLPALVLICNELKCSTDELLFGCIKDSVPIYELEFHESLKSCSAYELKIILDVVYALKTSLGQNIT